MPRLLHDSEAGLLFVRDGRDPAGVLVGEPADRGCDIQSSDNESSQAFSIVYQLDAVLEEPWDSLVEL